MKRQKSVKKLGLKMFHCPAGTREDAHKQAQKNATLIAKKIATCIDCQPALQKHCATSLAYCASLLALSVWQTVGVCNLYCKDRNITCGPDTTTNSHINPLFTTANPQRKKSIMLLSKKDIAYPTLKKCTLKFYPCFYLCFFPTD